MGSGQWMLATFNIVFIALINIIAAIVRFDFLSTCTTFPDSLNFFTLTFRPWWPILVNIYIENCMVEKREKLPQSHSSFCPLCPFSFAKIGICRSEPSQNHHWFDHILGCSIGPLFDKKTSLWCGNSAFEQELSKSKPETRQPLLPTSWKQLKILHLEINNESFNCCKIQWKSTMKVLIVAKYNWLYIVQLGM